MCRRALVIVACAACVAAARHLTSHFRTPLRTVTLHSKTEREEAKVRVAPASAKGMGCFAEEALEAGAWVCLYTGTLSTDEENNQRYGDDAKEGEGDYLFKVGDDLFVDAQNSSHFSRFFNHAENGTLAAEIHDRRVEFRAARKIEVGEELTFDYGTSDRLEPMTVLPELRGR